MIDGDTIVVAPARLNGIQVRVRYLCLDAPDRGEPGYEEAKSENQNLVLGQTVTLVMDTTHLDRYQRYLRYVYVGDTFVNRELVRHGYAKATRFPPDDAHYHDFRELERAAAREGRGLHSLGIFAEEPQYIRRRTLAPQPARRPPVEPPKQPPVALPSQHKASSTAEKPSYTPVVILILALVVIVGVVQMSQNPQSSPIPVSAPSTTVKKNNAVDSAPENSTPRSLAVGARSRVTSNADASAAGYQNKIETGIVTRVIDGDTIDVRIDGKVVRIRYVGMRAPYRDEACYMESSRANADLVQGTTIRLERDATDKDRYDRLLRYVFVGNVHINRVLVAEGFAEATLYQPDDKYFEEFQALEREAARAGLGCHPTGIFDDGSPTR